MDCISAAYINARTVSFRKSSRAAYAALGLIGLCSTALAADKPPLAPDSVAPLYGTFEVKC